MSRVTVRGERYSMAYGVDHMPTIGAFVQVWDHSDYSDPDCENILEEHDRLTTGGLNITEEFILELARKYSIPVDAMDIYRVFD